MSTDPPDDELEPHATDEGERGSNRVLRFAKRLMDRRELAEDTKDLLYAVLSTSDKAKSEAVRLTAKEIRNYLRELRLKEDLLELMTSHSLEVSISLKPLADRMKAPAPDDEG